MIAKVTKKARTYNEWTLTMTGLTAGKLLALKTALEKHALTSPVGADISEAVNRALNASDDYKNFMAQNG